MLSIERQTKIMQLLKQNTSVRVAELKEIFGVSEMTVRRDLEKLEQHGFVVRTHGGASINSNSSFDITFNKRNERYIAEKEAIGQAAAAMVEDGDSIILDAGTTTTTMARYLVNKKSLIVLTNSLTVAQELIHRQGITVILTGGQLRDDTLSLVGSLAEDNLRRFNVDKAFLGTSGLSVDQGLTNDNMYEAEVKRAMINIAQKPIVLADNSKFGRIAFNKFSSLTALKMLITDQGAPKEMVQQIKELGIEVLLAD